MLSATTVQTIAESSGPILAPVAPVDDRDLDPDRRLVCRHSRHAAPPAALVIGCTDQTWSDT